MIKKYLSAVLSVAVTVFFLWLALRKVSFSEVQHAASRMDLRYLAPMLAVVVFDLLVRALRWRILLAGAPASDARAEKPRVWVLFQLEAIGLALNNILLFRLGEFTRAYLAGVELKVSGFYALATVFVERALDMIALLSLFIVAAGMFPETVPAAMRAGAIVAVVGLACGLVFVSALDRAFEGGGAAWVDRLPEKASSLLRKAALGSRALRDPLALLAAVLLSLTLWMVDAGVYFLLARAMGLERVIGYGRSLVILSTAAAASALPAAPGSFGTFEKFVQDVLVSWSVSEGVALAYAGIVHLMFYLVVTFLGIAFLYRLGHTFGSLTQAAKENLG
ncbi:MAG: flippase-like domain-containing protein [Elusimicrobia bacterium]|nr:flippase-like domain-containing protein [Elusimicrobiota bacterium]